MGEIRCPYAPPRNWGLSQRGVPCNPETDVLASCYEDSRCLEMLSLPLPHRAIAHTVIKSDSDIHGILELVM
jgi:hypothetical protein